MQMKFKSKLYLGIALAIALVLIMGGLSYYANINERDTEDLVSHTIEVKAKLQDINIQMKDNAAAYRAKRRYKTFDTLMQTTDKTSVMLALNDLQTLVKDNRSQTANALSLRNEVNNLFGLWSWINPTETRSDTAKEAAYTRQESILMQNLKLSIQKMDSNESALLDKRKEANHQSMQFNNVTTNLGTLFILLLVIGLGVIIRAEFQKRNTAELSLNEKMEEQRKTNHQVALSNEVLSAAQVLMETCQKATSVPDFLQAVLDGILAFTGITSGIIYLAAEKKDTYHLLPCAHHGIPPEHVRETALDVLLTNNPGESKAIVFIENIPADFWHLSAATGQRLPGTIVYIYIKFKGQLLSVIELGSFQMPGDREREFLDMLPSGIAIRLSALQLTENRNHLLGELQEKQEALLNQQEELRQSNEELLHQTKVLQASEEELRVQEEELKQINTELEEKHDALELAHQVMDLKAAELEQSTKYKSEFLANMSHELRTPLNSILILANLLGDNKDKNLSAKQVEYAKIIGNSGSDLLKLINDILDLSKIEAGKIELSIETISVPNIVAHMRETFEVMADLKKIKFNVEINMVDDLMLSTDVQRLEQILKNLLSNAIKFTSEGGTVTLMINREPDNKVVFKVVDSGIGIDASKLDMIFEAFRQEDGSTNRRYGGTGLGLSISKELTKILKGTLRADSKVGQGSSFELYIPDIFSYEQNDVPLIGSVQSGISVGDADSGMDKTILIIEDDENFSAILKNFAEERSYRTLIAVNGQEGVDMAKKFKPDAIILDLQMPVMDGWEVLKILRNDPELMGIPVHVISAMDEDKAPKQGIVEYVRKPVTIEELELTFKHIGSYISAVKHRLLIWSPAKTPDNTLGQLIANLPPGVKYDLVTAIEDVIGLGKKHHYDCILADVGSSEKDFDYLQEIRENNLFSGTSLILLIDHEISATDEMRLKKISEAIVMKSKEAHKRLKDELELFMFRVKDHLPDGSLGSHSYVENNILDGKTVLVADDDMRNVFALVGLLENQKMKVVAASNGIEAINALRDNDAIDIVLMDIMMPEMDGYEAMRKIRALPQFRNLPIIALTAKAMSNDRELCIEAGASDYMSKPVNTQKLLSLIRIWLS
jgi:signal transduction histidine kinase/CheY-like chemotaxis protein/CHASE3 domain sensor protein